jgi:molecular chaperone GrpE
MTEPYDDEEALLAQFRLWLREARAEAEALEAEPPLALAGAEGEDVGLYRLVEEFTALRHELKLQTRSTRGLQEQAESLLPPLRQAIEQFRAVEPREAQAAWAAGRPLAEALADLDAALDRGRAEIEKARHGLIDEPAAAVAAELDALFARQSWFRRRRVRTYHEEVKEVLRGHGPESRRALFDALLEGYGLIQSRLRRTMAAEQLQRIDCIGRPVDPERMTVVEVVDDGRQAPGVVIDEVRRGYTWRGRVLRYAEVRATRTPPPAADDTPEPEPEPEPETDREGDRDGHHDQDRN